MQLEKLSDFELTSVIGIMDDGLEEAFVKLCPYELQVFKTVERRFGIACKATQIALRVVFDRAKERHPDEFERVLRELGYRATDSSS